MKVKEIMTQSGEYCFAEDNLKKAAEIMQQTKCETVAVINKEMALIGTITPETIFRAAATLERKASLIKIADIELEKAVNCLPDEKIEKALKKMSKNRVKQLIVTSREGEIIGIISIALVLGLPKNKKLQKKAFSVLKSIYKPRPLVLREIELPAEVDQ